MDETRVLEALRGVQGPGSEEDIVSGGLVRGVSVDGARVAVRLALRSLPRSERDGVVAAVRAAVEQLEEGLAADVTLVEARGDAEEGQRRDEGAARASHGQSQPGVAEHLNQIGRVIAVMSGKGGVGKSLVTALFATELRRRGRRVGILDADITGPSIPKIMGIHGHPTSSTVGIAPVRSAAGIRVMSINLLLQNEDDAVIWRGPLISGAVKQFWGDVFWGTLDELLVDLPPGTADVPLTVMQSLPVAGIVLVTSPQDLAGMVVRKAASMAKQLDVPILGVVENMSYAVCPHCGKQIAIFGPSHLDAICGPLQIPVLARIPLDPRIAELCDAGRVEEYQLPTLAGAVDLTMVGLPALGRVHPAPEA